MSLLVWILQILVALFFFAAGVLKITQPIDRLAKKFEWVKEVPGWLVRFIGVAETAGALGLVLPVLSGIALWLTPLAGLGLALIMFLAAGFNSKKTQFQHMVVNLVLLGLTAGVALARFTVVPF